MFDKFQQAVTLALVLSLCLTPAFAASLTAEQLQSVLEKAKVLPNSRISTRLAGAELTVSTYKIDMATEDDCKIDAVLIAKTAFSADSELARVMVLFYSEKNPTTYFEVPVTLGEVTAFGSGQLSKQQLLLGLAVNKRTVVSGNDTASGAKPTTTIPTAVIAVPPLTGPGGEVGTGSKNDKTKSSSDKEPKPVVRRSAYSNYGFTFTYPADLKVEYPQASNDVIRAYMTSTHSHVPVIVARVFPAKSMTIEQVVSTDPRETFQEAWEASKMVSRKDGERPGYMEYLEKKHKEWEAARRFYTNKGLPSQYLRWKEHELAEHGKLSAVALPANIKVGANKSIDGTQRGFWEQESSTRNFIRYVLFKSPGYLVALGLMCRDEDSARASAEFDQVLAELKCAAKAPGTKAVTSARKK